MNMDDLAKVVAGQRYEIMPAQPHSYIVHVLGEARAGAPEVHVPFNGLSADNAASAIAQLRGTGHDWEADLVQAARDGMGWWADAARDLGVQIHWTHPDQKD